ncbi:MAG: flagellar export protein FliJ [Spirochaetales bacterium]|nr:flagellar export protein FliJ [Spirochaetales bacterium]
MHKFRFNLERLLRIREHEEQGWKIKLGKAVSECVRIETRISSCGSEIERILLTRGSIENREADFFSMELYKRRMTSEIQSFSVELVEAQKRRDSVRETFIEHSKNRKVLSKLKEKREHEYYKKQLKIEFNEVDEINNSRAAGRTMR